MAKIKLYTCVSETLDYVGLNQIITSWQESGFIDRVQIDMKRDKRFISWVGRIGGLGLEPSDVERISSEYEYVLACQYRSPWNSNKKVLPWNFYTRDWKKYDMVKKELPYKKTIESIFSGTIRGNHNRNEWINSTEVFKYRSAKTFRRSNTAYPDIADYYRDLARSKFGLCPVGDCPVCQREIETMGLGCVPIYTEGVEWNYFVPPKENVHFLYVKSVQEMKEKIQQTSLEQIEYMAEEGIKYFDKYCSPTGLWNSVLETIDKYNISV